MKRKVNESGNVPGSSEQPRDKQLKIIPQNAKARQIIKVKPVLSSETKEILVVQVANWYSISAILKTLPEADWWNFMYFADVDRNKNNLKRSVDLEGYSKDHGFEIDKVAGVTEIISPSFLVERYTYI
jgi:hypothetical protein